MIENPRVASPLARAAARLKRLFSRLPSAQRAKSSAITLLPREGDGDVSRAVAPS